jgi:hypothetical protein
MARLNSKADLKTRPSTRLSSALSSLAVSPEEADDDPRLAVPASLSEQEPTDSTSVEPSLSGEGDR